MCLCRLLSCSMVFLSQKCDRNNLWDGCTADVLYALRDDSNHEPCSKSHIRWRVRCTNAHTVGLAAWHSHTYLTFHQKHIYNVWYELSRLCLLSHHHFKGVRCADRPNRSKLASRRQPASAKRNEKSCKLNLRRSKKLR